MMCAVDEASTERTTQRRGDVTRRSLLDAALVEFAASGFDAASTRAIAARAGVRQGQLTYHFETKDALWQATVDHLFKRFDELLATAAARVTPLEQDDARSRFEHTVTTLVQAVARLPELNRIMVHEATALTPRLEWMVERHIRARFELLAERWSELQDNDVTVPDADPIVIYYTVIGAASLLYVNTPEARILLGRDDIVDERLIAAHADLIVSMLLGHHRSGSHTPERY